MSGGNYLITSDLVGKDFACHRWTIGPRKAMKCKVCRRTAASEEIVKLASLHNSLQKQPLQTCKPSVRNPDDFYSGFEPGTRFSLGKKSQAGFNLPGRRFQF